MLDDLSQRLGYRVQQICFAANALVIYICITRGQNLGLSYKIYITKHYKAPVGDIFLWPKLCKS
jgi:hypothetical protein